MAGHEQNGTGVGKPMPGGKGDNWIASQEGGDSLDGEDGDNAVDGGDRLDEIYGGSGDDDLWGGVDNDFLAEQNGGDRLEGGDGDDGADIFAFWVTEERSDQHDGIEDFEVGIDPLVIHDYELPILIEDTGSGLSFVFRTGSNILLAGLAETDIDLVFDDTGYSYALV